MKAELKTLSKEHADVVAAHLMAAASLVESDPDLAFRHAEAAKRRASRLPIVREATAETAYAAGLFEEALSEFRALRRMNGSPDYLPVLADCERALGRHQAALKLIAEGDRTITDPSALVELRLVQAGVRADMGMRDEAVRLLRHELERPRGVVPKDAQARLRYAYADLLLAGGDETGAREWFSAAVRLDPEGQTDALDRLDELDGMVLTIDEDDLDDSEEAMAEAADEVAETDADATDEHAQGELIDDPDGADEDLHPTASIDAPAVAEDGAQPEPESPAAAESTKVEKPKRTKASAAAAAENVEDAPPAEPRKSKPKKAPKKSDAAAEKAPEPDLKPRRTRKKAEPE
jgi:tetratricopeptide (TPR) repeat protein